MIADNDTKQKAAIQFLGIMLDENMGGRSIFTLGGAYSRCRNLTSKKYWFALSRKTFTSRKTS